MEATTTKRDRRGLIAPSAAFRPGSRERYIHWWLLGPAVGILGILTLYPMIHAVSLAMQRYNLARPWIPHDFLGLGNFAHFFTDSMLGKSMIVTIKFGLATTAVEMLVGFGAAWLLSQKLRGSDAFRLVFLIPMIVVPVVGGLTWRLMFNANYGVINWVLVHLGVQPQVWLGTDWAMFSVITAEVWQSLPFSILIFTVALQQIPRPYYEAAALDGASPWRTFTQITLPNIRWAILIVAIFKLSDAIKSFDTIYTLTGGGPGITTQTLAMYIQNTAFTHSELGYAAALSFLILFISFVIMYPLIKNLNINA